MIDRSSSSYFRPALAAGRLCAAVLCLCLALPGLAPAQEQGEQDQAPTTGKRLKQTEQGLLRNIWWNQQEVVDKLALTQAQRAAMDAVFKSFRQERQVAQERNPILREAFAEALGQGRWQEARRLNQETAELAGDRVAAQPELKIDILSLLTTEQLATFGAEYEHLYQRPWFRRMTMGSGRQRSQGRGARQRPQGQGARQRPQGQGARQPADGSGS